MNRVLLGLAAVAVIGVICLLVDALKELRLLVAPESRGSERPLPRR